MPFFLFDKACTFSPVIINTRKIRLYQLNVQSTERSPISLQTVCDSQQRRNHIYHHKLSPTPEEERDGTHVSLLGGAIRVVPFWHNIYHSIYSASIVDLPFKPIAISLLGLPQSCNKI